MKSANETLYDGILVRSVLLEQFSNGLVSTIDKEYKKILDDIIYTLNTYKVVDITSMNKIVKEIAALVEPNITITEDLNELAITEAHFIAATANAAAGIEIIKKLPNESTLKRISKAPLFIGSTIMESFENLDNNLKEKLTSEIRMAIIQGETLDEIKSRVATRFGIVGNSLDTIVRTSVATLTSNVRQSVYDENIDVIKGWQFVATFDTRTSDVCMAYSNKQWDTNLKPIDGHSFPFRRPPLHPRCRSLMLPVLKSYKELGLNIDDIPNATRASMDGSVPQDMTMTQWLNRQSPERIESMLGKGRAKLFLDGKITINDLIKKNGESLTLDELNML